jgi:hypothetical protein
VAALDDAPEADVPEADALDAAANTAVFTALIEP